MPDELRQLIEEVKLRVPIEDLVRERVPELRQQGRLWAACCPFHEERTPSFKVDPARGTWRCYGACSDGGDVISFVERFDRLSFRESLELLAARVGLSLPERRGGGARERFGPLYELLERTGAYFARALRSAEGARALAYLRDRGLSDATIDAFGLGWAPGGGEVLVRRAAAGGVRYEDLEAVGLARRNPEGRAYDFFRDRLTIPIRDLRGRTVGFGARRLRDDDPRQPKYVNTPETALFHKGRLVYALDRAVDGVRRSAHLVLVEGYTDVMAAHQVGLPNVAAVLGTATTDDHAALVRRSGARRVTLVFDGDAAGRAATERALAGLLPSGADLDVVAPPEGEDPCDLLVRAGAEPFRARLAEAQPWLAFLLDGLEGRTGADRSEALDRILGLVLRMARPMLREEAVERIAERLGYPADSVREQLESLPERRRERRAREAEGTQAQAAASEEQPDTATDPRRREAWAQVAGALLLDSSLLAAARDLLDDCEDADLASILGAVATAAVDGGVSEDRVLTLIGEHPARALVGRLIGDAARAESPRDLFEGAVACLEQTDVRERLRRDRAAFAEAPDSSSRAGHLREIHQRLRHLKVPGAARSR